MSLDTTIAQAAAREAEADWSKHRKTCSQCGDRRRTAVKCPAGRQLHYSAQEARELARANARADRAPGPGDVTLFGADVLGGPWLAELSCGHSFVSQNPVKQGGFVSCIDCQAQRKVKSVRAGHEG